VTGSKLGLLLAPGLSGMKRNLLPGLVLQTCALFVVLAYAFLPSFHSVLDSVGTLKARYGYVFSAISTAIFGGVIPYLVLTATKQVPKGRALGEFAFYVCFWLWKGAEVDALYRLQGLMFGGAATIATIASKTCVDQFIYNTLWAAPTQVVFFLWKDAGFSRSGLIQGFKDEPFGRRVVVILFSGWIVWIPAVMIIYSLPSALQVPLFNLVLCFWCLLLSFISRSTLVRTG
jgi:hypothetical protein